eukprot:GHVN01079812.1.p1 GENE.GHVN01079812.1~~GHVN01079812.1.p1  ORF type:complete len:260 (-),score=45.20 GHVN01079812.1:485-1264(-)
MFMEMLKEVTFEQKQNMIARLSSRLGVINEQSTDQQTRSGVDGVERRQRGRRRGSRRHRRQRSNANNANPLFPTPNHTWTPHTNNGPHHCNGGYDDRRYNENWPQGHHRHGSSNDFARYVLQRPPSHHHRSATGQPNSVSVVPTSTNHTLLNHQQNRPRYQVIDSPPLPRDQWPPLPNRRPTSFFNTHNSPLIPPLLPRPPRRQPRSPQHQFSSTLPFSSYAISTTSPISYPSLSQSHNHPHLAGQIASKLFWCFCVSL